MLNPQGGYVAPRAEDFEELIADKRQCHRLEESSRNQDVTDSVLHPILKCRRADGKRHGLTSALSLGEKVLVASKGGGVTLSLDVGQWSEG